MQRTFSKTFLHIVTGLLVLFGMVCHADESQRDELKKTAKENKILIGDVENDRYISHDNSFSFKLPIKGSLHELKAAIKDTLSLSLNTVTIKSPGESTNYRFDISSVPPGNNENSQFVLAADKTFDWYRRLIQRSWKAPITEIVNEEFNWHGRPAAHVIFKQFSDAGSGPRYHIFYLADFSDKVILLWTNINLPEENLAEEDNIISARSGPALNAKQSFLSFRLN